MPQNRRRSESVNALKLAAFCPARGALRLVVSFDKTWGQRWVNKLSSSRPKAFDPQSAQPCAFANVPETTREHRHPLLIPRSLVRSQHGSNASERNRDSERQTTQSVREITKTRTHGESQGHRGTEGGESADGCGLRRTRPHRLRFGSTGGQQLQPLKRPAPRVLNQRRPVVPAGDALHAKEGVDGSSPSGGFKKPLQIGFYVVCPDAVAPHGYCRSGPTSSAEFVA